MSENLTPLRWGILGAGGIAKRVSNDVVKLSDHKLYAVGSRDKAKADEFANSYDIPNRYGSYEELCADPDVDLIYVATPHNFHKEHTLLALDHGKAVLCEKPFTINFAEAKTLVEAARAKNIFLMEGMWSRCFPAMAKVRSLIAEGAIGEPRILEADFGFRSGVTPESRLYNPALGGGGLLARRYGCGYRLKCRSCTRPSSSHDASIAPRSISARWRPSVSRPMLRRSSAPAGSPCTPRPAHPSTRCSALVSAST